MFFGSFLYYPNMSNTNYEAHCYVYILSRVVVSMDGVWAGN
jgi:hypothetical protein